MPLPENAYGGAMPTDVSMVKAKVKLRYAIGVSKPYSTPYYDELRVHGIRLPAFLCPIRTAKGRELRRQGVEAFSNRFLTPRTDKIANTITSVLKDDLIMTKMKTNMDDLSYHEHPTKEQLLEYFSRRIRIRKMTEREAMRLMDVDDADIDKIMALPFKSMQERREYFASKKDELQRLETELASLKAEIKDGKWVLNNEGVGPETKKQVNTAIKQYRANKSEINCIKRRGIAKTAVYRLAGNSIVTNCLYWIFYKIFIDKSNPNPQLTLF